MKKSTGILLFLSFIACFLILVGILIILMISVLEGTPPSLFGSNRVALIRVEGLIYDAQDWIDELKEYSKDRSIQGIILRVDSPGGAVGPSQDLYQAVVNARKEHGKVIVASFGSIAASGGYYIACGADRIVTSPGCLTGSIGVYAKFLLVKDLFEKLGVDYETVKAGEYKNFGAMERGLTDKEREMMQFVIDDTYEQFIDAVADGRLQPLNQLLRQWEPSDATPWYPFTAEIRKIIQDYQDRMLLESASLANNEIAEATNVSEATTNVSNATAETETIESASAALATPTPTLPPRLPKPSRETLIALVKKIADGKVYTGKQALEIGLVDQIGTLEDAIHLTAKLCGIEGEVSLVEARKSQLSLLDFLSQKLSALTQAKTFSPLEYRFPF